MVRTIAGAWCDRVCVIASMDADFPDAEWSDVMRLLKERPPHEVRGLVFTEGGGPNAVQRGHIVELLGTARAPFAVVSNALRVRGILTALAWFNPAIKGFAPAHLDAAVAHVGESHANKPALLAKAHELSAQLARPLSILPRA